MDWVEILTTQHITKHQEVEADAVLLNVPQLPLLRLLSASAEASLGLGCVSYVLGAFLAP